MVAMLATSGAVMAQNGITEVPDAGMLGTMATAMSPNGRYIGGSVYATDGGFLFDRETKKVQMYDALDVNTDLQIKSISNDGLAVGWNGPACTFDFNTNTVKSFGAADQYLFIGISPNGKLIVGARYDGDDAQGTPCYFSNGTPVDLPQSSDKFLGYNSDGASALSVSDDSLISGYYVDNMATRPATLWALNKDGKTFSSYPISRRFFASSMESTMPYVIFSCDQTVMSANGKWLAVNFEKYISQWESVKGVARYNTENDSVDFFIANEDDDRFADVGTETYAFAVSNDGTVVGFYGSAYQSRVAYRWKKGEADIERLATAFPGATRLAAYDEGGFNTPSGISADGRYISGFGYAADTTAEVEDGEEPQRNWVSWILDTEDPAASVGTGVEKVQVNKANAASVRARYAIDGTKRQSKFKGLNILQLTNGKAIKTIEK